MPVDDLRAHEASLDVGVDLAGGVPGGQAAAQVPRVGGLVLTRGEEGDAVEQRERLLHHQLQARLAHAELSAHHGGVRVGELGQLGLDARGKRHRARPLGRGVLCHVRGDLDRSLFDVRHEQHRLGCERAQIARGIERLLGDGNIAYRPPGAQVLDHLLQPGVLGHRHTVAATGLFGDALDATLGLLEVG